MEAAMMRGWLAQWYGIQAQGTKIRLPDFAFELGCFINVRF
jgi:hypothetical protein